jgi:glycosyltransferase involved in cell wall biosynthesis
MSIPSHYPLRILITGGPDVDLRIDLMRALQNEFCLAAVGSSHDLGAHFSEAGFDYHYYPLRRGINPVMDLYVVAHLYHLFRRLKPDVVHTFDTKPCVWGRLAAWLAQVPIIVGTLSGLGSLYTGSTCANRATRVVYQPLQKLACHVSDLTIFQNQDDTRQFITDGVAPEPKAKVIPGSGVATDLFNPTKFSHEERAQVRGTLGLQADELVVTMISRIIRSKGILEFAHAARAVRTQYPDTQFLLIGPEDKESVDPLTIEELGHIKQEVTWLGPRRDIVSLLAASDIFVLPTSYREGIPRVLLEAASMGLPIVTTDLPGCKEVVTNRVNGLVIPVKDSNALSRAITQLIEQPELRHSFGILSRQRVLEQFDISSIAHQIAFEYRQLLACKVPKEVRGI